MASKLYWFYGHGCTGKTTAAQKLLSSLGNYCNIHDGCCYKHNKYLKPERIDKTDCKHILIDGGVDKLVNFNILFLQPSCRFETVVIITDIDPTTFLISNGASQEVINLVHKYFALRYFPEIQKIDPYYSQQI